MRQEIAEIAREASALILRLARGEDLGAASKADGSPVTRADLAANALIVGELGRRWPYPVIAEESPIPPHEVRRTWRRLWLVDPLDGTRDFLAGSGDFTVNIALIEDGRPIAGAICAPMRDTVWSAALGEGAWRGAASAPGPEVPIRCARESGPSVMLASRFHRDAALDAFAREHGIDEIRTYGSAVKLALIAEGSADAYPRMGRTMEWDIAAGHAIIATAGGSMTELETGAEIRYNGPLLESPAFLACTPRFHEKLRRA